MRAAGAAGLLSETLSGLCVASLFGLIYAIKGGFALPADQSLPLACRVALPLYRSQAVEACRFSFAYSALACL